MRITTMTRRCLVGLTCLAVMLPQLARAAAPARPDVHQAADIALGTGGQLAGQVMDRQGVAQANTGVWLVRQGELVATTETDADGRFAVNGLQGGVYQIITTGGGGMYRLWAERTAPPVASQTALVVGEQDIVRGQMPGLGLFSNPWVIGAIIATAIAIPVALDDNDAS